MINFEQDVIKLATIKIAEHEQAYYLRNEMAPEKLKPVNWTGLPALISPLSATGGAIIGESFGGLKPALLGAGIGGALGVGAGYLLDRSAAKDELQGDVQENNIIKELINRLGNDAQITDSGKLIDSNGNVITDPKITKLLR